MAIDWDAFSAIATAVAVVVALGGYAFLEWQRRLALKLARRSAAHMIGIRTARLLNKLTDLHIYFGKFPKIDWRQSSSLLPPVHPLIGTSPDTLAWPANDEISLLIEMKEADFLSDIMLVAGRLESITISMAEYAKRYDELYRMIPPPVSMKETLASHDLTKEEVLKLRPYSIQLFGLIYALKSMVDENIPLMKKLAHEYHPMMKRRFPGEKFISLSLANSDATSERSGR